MEPILFPWSLKVADNIPMVYMRAASLTEQSNISTPPTSELISKLPLILPL